MLNNQDSIESKAAFVSWPTGIQKKYGLKSCEWERIQYITHSEPTKIDHMLRKLFLLNGASLRDCVPTSFVQIERTNWTMKWRQPMMGGVC